MSAGGFVFESTIKEILSDAEYDFVVAQQAVRVQQGTWVSIGVADPGFF